MSLSTRPSLPPSLSLSSIISLLREAAFRACFARRRISRGADIKVLRLVAAAALSIGTELRIPEACEAIAGVATDEDRGAVFPLHGEQLNHREVLSRRHRAAWHRESHVDDASLLRG